MGLIYSQLVKAQLENLAADPASNPDGLVYLNTTTDVVKWYAGAAWRTAVDTDTVQSLSGKTFTDDVQFTSTGAIKFPVGTTGERPSADAGDVRFNTTRGTYEGYDGADWVDMAVTGGGSAPFLVTANYTAASGDIILANASGGSFTVTLPLTPTTGDIVEIFDATGDFAANNVTVARNGENINASASDLTADVEGVDLKLVYINGTQGWRVY